jgi:SAM-dependent methyltransferase
LSIDFSMNRQGEQQSPDFDVTAEVRNFYERYPYPPPVENLDIYQWHWQDQLRRRADFHLFWPASPFRGELSILVAGCGTSQAAKYALRWPAAQVTGIDFSATSVRCTGELKREYKLDNLQVHQLPIERAGELETTFDQIVCTGVLHHLPDPDAGLSALRRALKPEGAMQLMVYAPYGRTGIYMLQEFCRRTGIRAADDEIRNLIEALKALPPGHPLEKLLREAPDFQHEAALADALLHPQDRAYSVPQFFDFIQRGGLTFGRWIKQAPYSPHCGVLAKIPQASRIAQLPPVEQYAAVELFRGVMVSHSAILYRNDNPGPQQVSFAGDDWPGYAPIRLPDTICVQERLPPGAAAVLINRSHTFKDLILPIDSTEMSLVEAIDGNCRVSEIVERKLASLHKELLQDAARRFFERLWLYDQVVFDAS